MWIIGEIPKSRVNDGFLSDLSLDESVFIAAPEEPSINKYGLRP
jgi:hypothetical protein